MMDEGSGKRVLVGSGMTCCFAGPEQWEGSRVELSDEEAHHLVRVLRMKDGDAVRVLDGAGRCADGVLSVQGRRDVRVTVANIQTQPPLVPRLVLLQALIKNSRMEWLVQKAVELGVSQIMPVTAEHSVVKAKTAGGEARRQRLLSVAVSAQKQCSILWLPEITEPMSLEEALNSVSENNDTLVLYGALEVAALPLRECLRTRKGNVPQQIALAVGPEGDFSMQEYGLLEESGAMAVSLGNNILRSETAALHMISALRYEFATV